MAQTLNYTRIPAPRVSLVDPQTGVVANEWFRFFNNLYSIAYAGTNTITAGTYGTATNVAQVTVNDFGSITNINNVPIAINASQVVAGTFNGLGFINGTINSSTIGSVTPATGTFTTATASKYVGISGGEF
jgi:outer membrane lipoprotein SlyB